MANEWLACRRGKIGGEVFFSDYLCYLYSFVATQEKDSQYSLCNPHLTFCSHQSLLSMCHKKYEVFSLDVSCHMSSFQILTKDSVTVFVNAIMYYKVRCPTSAVANVDDYSGSAQLLAATTLRSVTVSSYQPPLI